MHYTYIGCNSDTSSNAYHDIHKFVYVPRIQNSNNYYSK